MNQRFAQLPGGHKDAPETHADPLKTANDTAELPSASQKRFPVLRRSSKGSLPSTDSFEEMEEPVGSKKSSKGAKRALKTAKPKAEPRDALPGISKSMSRKKVEDQLDEAELGDKIEAIISPKTEREAAQEPGPDPALPKPKSQVRLAPMVFGSPEQVGGGEPKRPAMHKSASLNKPAGAGSGLSPEKGQLSAPKPLLSVLGRLKAGSPLQAIKSVFKKRRRRG